MNVQRHGKTIVEAGVGGGPDGRAGFYRLAHELRLTGQILTIDVDTVRVTSAGPIGATSLDGTEIMLGARQLPVPWLNRRSLAAWLGVFAHEVGHVLYTPREGSLLWQRMKAAEASLLPGILELHNIVEDQREERYVIARFQPWEQYLIVALTHLFQNPGRPTAWWFVCGRTWLPPELRATARASYVAAAVGEASGELEAALIAKLIGEYQRLSDPGDADSERAFDILEELHALQPPSHGGCGHQPIQGGEAEAGDEQGAPEAADEADTDCGPDEAPGEGNVGEQLDEAADQAADSGDVSDELDGLLDEMTTGKQAGNVEHIPPATGRHEDVTDHARLLAARISRSLELLKAETEPGWERRTSEGRLNVRRWAIRPDEWDSLYDRYLPGQYDAADLEVVLAVDVSGSMTSVTHELGESVWAIRYAADRIEARITVMAWNFHTRVMAAPGERVERMFIPDAEGGTSPTSVIREARQIFDAAPAPTRLLLMLTDGEWSPGAADWRLNLEAMKAQGVITALAAYDEGRGKAEFQHNARVATLDDLAVMFERLAADAIQARLAH